MERKIPDADRDRHRWVCIGTDHHHLGAQINNGFLMRTAEDIKKRQAFSQPQLQKIFQADFSGFRKKS